MNRAVYLALVLVVVLGAAALGFFLGGGSLSGRSDVGEGSAERFYRLSLPDHLGQAQSIGQWRGQVMVLNYWATWCPPCKKEIPDLVRISRDFVDKGVVVVGLSIDDGERVRAFRDTLAMPYPVLVGDHSVLELSATLGNPTQGLPFTLLVGRDGQIVRRYIGLLDPQELRSDIKDLLAKAG